jgi:glycine C-acetyltransferase
VINFCANNYLGLANHPDIVAEAKTTMDRLGYGMASVRFICGTTDEHRALELDIASYVGSEASITFAACFDANGAVFEPLLGPEDAIISDSLNHASIIDGVRLSKARRYRFESRDMRDLAVQLEAARLEGSGAILIVTDGVFSMDGYLADLPSICELADEHGALVMVDDCHATGLVGPEGRGTPSYYGVEDRVDIVTSTLGKALGGAMGGFVAANAAVVDLLRQRGRPYLFSNALSPAHVGGARAALRLALASADRRATLHANAQRFRAAMTDVGFTLTGADHPIIPVMLGDARVAGEMASRLMELGVYVTPFSYPVVPRGQARIRTQMSAAHTADDIDTAVAAFVQAATELGLEGGTR